MGILSPPDTFRREGVFAVRREKRVPQNPPDGDMSPMALSMRLINLGHPVTDPQGSWTGVPADPRETPVQDADDL